MSNPLIYLDDGDGLFNVGDIQITSVNLDADASANLFFVSDVPVTPSWITSQQGIKAVYDTGGSGIRGTIYPLTYYSAVDGYKGGVDSALCEYELVKLGLILNKSVVSNTAKIYRGTRLTYTIEVSVDGDGIIQNIIIRDDIPTGTVYISNTVFLDGILLSDSLVFSNGKLSIPVVDMSKGEIHTITFDVIVE